MGKLSEHEYTTYPRRFDAYRWYKPIIVSVLFGIFLLIAMLGTEAISKILFHAQTVDTGLYDDMDFFTAAGAFSNGASAAVPILALILAVLIVKDRPMSSYFSSMGGWRWRIFLKTLVAAFIIQGVPIIVNHIKAGRTGDVRFTLAGLLILTLFIPFQCIAEELTFRGLMVQTISSWFKLPAAGILVQIVFFTLVHPYNAIGRVEIAVSALIYALVCYITKGLESGSALHIANNASEIYAVGFGFGVITSEQTVPDMAFNLFFKLLFILFIIFAYKKLHWFDEVKYDDVAAFNAKRAAKQ